MDGAPLLHGFCFSTKPKSVTTRSLPNVGIWRRRCSWFKQLLALLEFLSSFRWDYIPSPAKPVGQTTHAHSPIHLDHLCNPVPHAGAHTSSVCALHPSYTYCALSWPNRVSKPVSRSDNRLPNCDLHRGVEVFEGSGVLGACSSLERMR